MSETKLELPFKGRDGEEDADFNIHSQMDELYGLLNHEIKERGGVRSTDTAESVEEALMEDEISLETEKLEDDASYPTGIEVPRISREESYSDESSDPGAGDDPPIRARPDPDILLLRTDDVPDEVRIPAVVRRRVIRHGSQSEDSILKIVERLKEEGELARAEAMVGMAIERNPGSMRMNMLMGKILFESGRIQESQRYFDRALNIDNQNPEPWLYLGLISLNSDPPNRMEALIFFQQARKLDPGNPLIEEYLSQCHLRES
ncbi:MAG: tetratricopeptide repeat protein [Thermoplasmatota archaeon]